MFTKQIVLRVQQHTRYFSTKITMDSPIVAVKEGKLKGLVRKLLDGSDYYSFKGVPYASPPVGDLRFKAPLPPKKWQGVRDAKEHGSVCPQYDIYTTQIIEGSEDCLFLNIYTKTLETTSNLPVMVFIHGGAFMSGSGDENSYGPLFLLQHDVLLITLNYRLEVLGFLSLDTPEVPGNAGMKDQVAALRWIKENISKFGGNPDNITLFGESAGGASVTYHLLSPMSKGLFHKAIAQSGSCTNDWAHGSAPRERAFRAGKYLGIDTTDASELLKQLQSLPAKSLPKLTIPTRTNDEKFRGLPLHFVPVIEKKFDNIEQFMTEDSLELLLKRQSHEIPLIIGYNSAEGLMALGDIIKKADVFNRQPSFLLPKEIAHKLPKEKVIEMGERLKEFYVGDKGFSADVNQNLVNVHTDRQFSYNVHRFAHFYSKIEPTFMFIFDCVTDLNIGKIMMGYSEMEGACHTDELFYMFSTGMALEAYKNQKKLRDAVFKITKMWTDFAKTGNPTPNESLGFEWRPFKSSTEHYFYMGESFGTRSHADQRRIQFWDKLYAESGLPCISKQSKL